MGCASSTEAAATSAKKEDKTVAAERSSISAPHAPESRDGIENKERETTKATTSTLHELGKLRIQYACLSRRGHDSEDPSKPNQDSYSVHHGFCDTSSDTFFGVYDGHGPTGEACSGFVKQRLPHLIHHKIKQHDNSILTTDQIQASMHEAHTQCNEELHASGDIDDSSSGTTSITMYMQGAYNRITICNVGDSRAVLGTKTQATSDGDGVARLKAVSLSTDHTPHRSDEAQRCISSGARILTFGQISPHDDDDDSLEDPPRVWAKNAMYPGTAFTRSIGDAMAEKLGVIAEPEMLSLKISPKEKVVVLASDGVFDVMSNQQVIDLCYQYYNEGPAEACRAVVEHSHKEWLNDAGEECVDGEESGSYDDMTIACIFVYDDDDELEVENDNKMNGAAATTLPVTAADADNGTDTPKLPPPSKASRHSKRHRQKTLRNLDDVM